MRIAVIYEEGIVNSYYRAVLPMRELERRGHRVLWPVNPTFTGVVAELPSCDAVHIHRLSNDKDIALVERLHDAGIAVVWDNDDDLRSLPRLDRGYRKAVGWRDRKRAFAQSVRMAKAADMMTTPSPHLADRYRAHGVERVAVVENHLAHRDVAHARPRHRGVVIGCTLGAEHAIDLKRTGVVDGLRRILATFPNVRVTSIGLDLGLESRSYTRVAAVPVEKLVERKREFDIALAPLVDTPFNRSRSNIKLKEYAAAGAMWLASPVGPYEDMSEKEGGQLVQDGTWFDTIAGNDHVS